MIAGLQSITVIMYEKELTKCLLDLVPYEKNEHKHINDCHSENLIIEIHHLLGFSKITYKGQNLIDKFASEGKTIKQMTFKSDLKNVVCYLVYTTASIVDTDDGCRTDIISHTINDVFSL